MAGYELARGQREPLKAIEWSAFFFALLQSACTAVLTVSGLRVAIGLSSLAAATGVNAPATGFHQDAIRYPMLALAALGSLVNLYVLWRIRSLRQKPAAQWRQKPLSKSQRRGELAQMLLSLVTLALVALELWTHPMLHHAKV